MSFAYVSEYSDVLQNASGTVQIACEPRLAKQKLAVSGVASLSNPFGPATRFIRINTDVVLSFLVSSNGAPADTTEARMAANQTEYFKVNAGDSVSVVANT